MTTTDPTLQLPHTRYGQISFDGATREETAITRLQNFEPPEGYHLAFSGGKDSVLILDLAIRAGVRFDAHYQITGCDPPELVNFIKTFHDVTMEHPPRSIWNLIPERGLPRRQGRWCCGELKEIGGSGRIVVTGIRTAESKNHTRRSHRKMVETCYRDSTKRFLNPVVDWSDDEVWGYLNHHHIARCSLYAEGFHRLGCVLCPMAHDVRRQMTRWPRIAMAWQRAASRYYHRYTAGTARFRDFNEYWHWWLDRSGRARDPSQVVMYD